MSFLVAMLGLYVDRLIILCYAVYTSDLPCVVCFSPSLETELNIELQQAVCLETLLYIS